MVYLLTNSVFCFATYTYFEFFLFFLLPSYLYIISCHETYCVTMTHHNVLSVFVERKNRVIKVKCIARKIIDSQGFIRKAQIYFFMV